MKHLFSPVEIGNIQSPNRIAMAPMTRGRADEGRVAGDLIAQHYAQRASAGLIITEATAVSAQGYGWNGAPAMYTDAHEKGWARTTAAVHAAGGRIVLQLWHMGRVSHPDFLNGELPVAPSPIAAAGESHTPGGKKPYVEPRALTAAELPGVVADYVASAERAIRAGFDGVEVHCANGYLLDQFLRDGTNRRTDEYGGNVEGRVRFPLGVVRAVVGAVGADKVGVRVSPRNPFNDIRDSDPVELFTHFAKQLDAIGIAYLHVMEPFSVEHPFHGRGEYVTPHLRKAFGGHLMINGGYDAAAGEQALAEGRGDSVAYGVPYIANPDFVERLRDGKPLAMPDFDTFYTPGPKGYTDYPPAD